MKEIINITYDKKLGKSISEVTSISLDTDYEILEENIKGKFLIEGTYKTHGLCLNQEEINFPVPFEYPIKENINRETLKIEVSDFTYNIEADTLCVDIEFNVLFEENKEEEDFSELDRYIKSYEIDLDDIKEEIKELEEESVKEAIVEETATLENEVALIPIEEENNVSETLVESVEKKSDEYITYHIYVCNENDTLEEVAKKYNIEYSILKEYNHESEIKLGTKLIIPYTND